MNDLEFIQERENETRRTSNVLTGWETVVFQVEDEPGVRFLHRFVRAFESDLRVSAVAERLDRRSAATAERRFLDFDRIALRVGEGELPFDNVGTVVADLDVDGHGLS